MGVDDGLFAGSALEVIQVLWIVHEEVICEDCGAEGVAEDVEVFFPVGVVVGVVCSDASVWEVLFCSFVYSLPPAFSLYNQQSYIQSAIEIGIINNGKLYIELRLS